MSNSFDQKGWYMELISMQSLIIFTQQSLILINCAHNMLKIFTHKKASLHVL